MSGMLPDYNMSDLPTDSREVFCGDHLARLIQVDELISRNTGRKMWGWSWKIIEGWCTGRKILSFTDDGTKLNHPLMIEALDNHLLVMGFKDGGYVDTDEYIGKKAVLVVVLYEKEGSKSGARPYVERILPPQAAHLK